jgi:hypothetical protein
VHISVSIKYDNFFVKNLSDGEGQFVSFELKLLLFDAPTLQFDVSPGRGLLLLADRLQLHRIAYILNIGNISD